MARLFASLLVSEYSFIGNVREQTTFLRRWAFQDTSFSCLNVSFSVLVESVDCSQASCRLSFANFFSCSTLPKRIFKLSRCSYALQSFALDRAEIPASSTCTAFVIASCTSSATPDLSAAVTRFSLRPFGVVFVTALVFLRSASFSCSSFVSVASPSIHRLLKGNTLQRFLYSSRSAGRAKIVSLGGVVEYSYLWSVICARFASR